MTVILTAIGLLMLLVSLAGIAFGVYMSADPRTRGRGVLFAVWWVPAVAAASGVLMRDVVTFAVGLLCFLVAGAVFAFDDTARGKPTVRRKGGSGGAPRGGGSRTSERTTKENKSGRYGGRAAS